MDFFYLFFFWFGECECVKTRVMEGLHFGFQMCELSCFLSLRWSLSVCLQAHSESFHPALDLLGIASVLTDHSPDPQKHDKVKPHHISRIEQLMEIQTTPLEHEKSIEDMVVQGKIMDRRSTITAAGL